MRQIELIRSEEKKYHDYCYDNYKLFEAGSWLHRPVKTVMELLPYFDIYEEINVLDLGCGVGRNSIPVAKAFVDKQCRIDCVDLLDSAIRRLKDYSSEYGVSNLIKAVKANIEDYHIKPNEYDFIIAVSSIEHVDSQKQFDRVIRQMAAGTKNGGINCIIVNSDVKEMDIETGEKLPVQMEINISTSNMKKKLEEMYGGWNLVKQIVKPLEYNINRNGKEILLRTNAITYVVRK
ncbi:methyltransferase domain-containing protein [Ornithinibacillus sp. L9]|uniref:Methyltransferase domain-containing protein n=1 Tax=Ornithinibacillus caprae TaxID=2678566 RepID=A0A6N8FMD0_9BACI|nr:class I SAM-dependent methyltransferase [Ornithinibacillus caprae]MUK88899.1 methyltransferase domain-containing protein [Ornithinibacillus caprae]